MLTAKVSVCVFQWAFGVLIWELLTLAQQPYADVDPFEMATYLKEGFRIAQPINCPDELWVLLFAAMYSQCQSWLYVATEEKTCFSLWQQVKREIKMCCYFMEAWFTLQRIAT